MKKILNLLIIGLFSIILVACNETESGLVFEYKTEFTYVIGESKPNYKEGIEVSFNGVSLTSLLMIDESNINYEEIGTYDLIYYVRYQSIRYEKISKVKVTDKSIDPEKPIEPEIPIDFENEVTLDFYYLNDLHGALLEENKSIGISKIANLVKKEKETRPHETIFLSGGDMLQGQIISNWYDGANAIEIFNEMGMDAFVIGNHEFDWGFNEVLKYFNKTFEIQANFPVLGANIYDNNTNKLVDGLEEYTIIEKSGVRIAVIGTIGSGLESSISYPRVKDYYFIDPATETKRIAKHVRENEDADIVIAINHNEDDSFNNSVTSASGNQAVDLVFNGHTHQAYVRTVNNKYVLQSGANGENVGNVSIRYNKEQNKIITSKAQLLNKDNNEKLNSDEAEIKTMMDGYYNEISHLFESILPSKSSYDQGDISKFIAELIQKYTNADAGIHNSGGTRHPIGLGEEISYAKLFQIFPFDNTIVLVTVSGSEFRNQTNRNVVYKKSGLGSISNSGSYVIATNDYIFGNSSSLRDSDNVVYTGITILDIIVEAVENQKEDGYTTFSLDNPIRFDSQLMLITEYYLPKEYIRL